MGVSEVEIEVHCEAGGILTKGRSKAQIGIFGLIREKVNGGVKIKAI